MQVAAGSDGIQRLLAAEAEAQRIVGEARKAKGDRLRQAKAEAEKEIAAYRAEREGAYQKKIAEASGPAPSGSSGSQATFQRLQSETNLAIQKIQADVKAKKGETASDSRYRVVALGVCVVFMSYSLPQSPSRSGRPRTKGATASSGGKDGKETVVRGALSGNIGASPFGILATTPELPVSTGTCITAVHSLQSINRQGQSILSLRRLNSSSNGSMAGTVSGGLAPVSLPAPSVARGGVFMRRMGAALLVLQLVLIGALLSRLSLVHSLTDMAKSVTVPHLGSHGQTVAVAEVDESSTIAIVTRLAAESRRSARDGAMTASRRERMWPTIADLTARRQQQDGLQKHQQITQSGSPAHPVRLVAAGRSTAMTRTATAMETASNINREKQVAKAAAASKPIAFVNSTAPTSNGDNKGTKTAATGTTAEAAIGTKFPPFAKPVVPFVGRVANPPTIVGVVFYGRRDRVRILDCYLQRNMARNGGLLTYVVFVTATWQPDDVEFLDRLVAMRGGEYRKLYPQRLDKGYTGHYAWMDPATIYVKIDDDVVYIADDAIDHMLIAHNLHRYHLISANVVNHQPLELPHSQSGAHYMYEQTRPAGRLGVYNFPPNEQLWDFNKHVGYTRWRINMIMFKAANIDVHVYNMSSTVDTYPGDDEDYITRILPKQLNRTSAAVSQALAVHFSFFMQRAGLENNTDLLDRYTLLAERTCGRLVPLSP
ncbi:hypothetical protein VOLCADRAFT_121088 [Volvox carteri f. nagariensis]|uniref:V-type proton ATPase subunit G n=1 Tax=Volvox carteri f. nagariensis TaxID=3068 RepID=D8U203_VOLCA|nr:uncharacterized protein VOLCADRAFT_121088 [Volvox carteri f. nagariensis]EFJ46198.1 hypothetical protein VOLCADRAFT_121088 [Volvox carteri f. nagariensis]|eukprot:XP_002952645.1 hypothetical protein VOLCADRAFT_121088 [Volvox carteri f. nagariensis]